MIDAATNARIELAPVASDQVVSGSPRTGFAELGEFNGQEYGVWEMTPGAMTDVEADELFIVLSGAATVEFIDDQSVVAIAAGSVGRLAAGMRTVWTVTETLRKVYVTPSTTER